MPKRRYSVKRAAPARRTGRSWLSFASWTSSVTGKRKTVRARHSTKSGALFFHGDDIASTWFGRKR